MIAPCSDRTVHDEHVHHDAAEPVVCRGVTLAELERDAINADPEVQRLHVELDRLEDEQDQVSVQLGRAIRAVQHRVRAAVLP